ncbi:hypothetical protein ACFDR9_001677 [Janthinobacterium sp. CG_23.3]|uniref:C1q-like domain-containing protein n=1 Tax=Janthinobacterium sp. CG_23.3 TaxID=3349634 RepID=UPI0038D3E9E3
MSVSNQETVFHYVGNGVTVTFPYACQVQLAADLDVYLNNTLITSGITINGIGAPTGGSVTFAAAPASGASVRLERVVELTRITDYQQNGDFLARVVNPDFDRLWMALQQMLAALGRTIRFPPSEAIDAQVLPVIALRANTLLGFDSAGDVVSVAPADQSASALALALAGPNGVLQVGNAADARVLAASNGVSLIGIIRAATGAVAATADNWFQRQDIHVFEFMSSAMIADVESGAMAMDHTAAVQSAINAAVTKKRKGVLFGAGTFKISSPITWHNATSMDQPGIAFVGDGRDATILRSFIANGPVFDIRGTKSFASGGTGSRFFNGGGIYAMRLDGQSATGTSDGISVQGWQYAEIVGCYITTFPRDGVRQWVDTGFPNADYSSSSINIIDTWLWDCTGQGVNQTGAIGAWSWKFEKSLFGYCGMGATITSAGNAFFDCSFVGSGYSPAGVARSGGSHLQIGSIAGGTNRITMRGCEFDFARLAHVKLDYCSTVTISQCRFIFNDRNATGTLTPSVGGVVIAPDGAGSNVVGVHIDHCNVRIDTAGTCNAFVIANSSNTINIRVVDTTYSNNSRATLNKYVGFTSSNFNVRYDYCAIDGGLSSDCIPGRPLPEYIGQATSPTVPASAVVIFGTQEALNLQIFAATLYNTATGVFTCPVTGYYDVAFSIVVVSATTAEYYQFQLRKNAVLVTEFNFSGNSLYRTLMAGSHRLHCNAGDAIDIFSSGVSGKAITGSYSQFFIKLSPWPV